jgi:hypothetical protein
MYAVKLKRLERQLDKLQQQQQQQKKRKTNNKNNNKKDEERRSNDGSDDNKKLDAIDYLFPTNEQCHFLITLLLFFCSASALYFYTILNISSLK